MTTEGEDLPKELTKKKSFFQNLIIEGFYNVVDENGNALSREYVRAMDRIFDSLMNENKTKHQNKKNGREVI